MSNFELQQEGFEGFTSIPNNFIENYMPTAAGEFVKIYIYLIKCVSENCHELSISKLADVFNNTEKDTTRALKYWQRQGLLKLSFNEDGSLRSLVLTSGKNPEEETIIKKTEEETHSEAAPLEAASSDAAQIIQFPEQRQYSRSELKAFSENDSNRMLIFVIQKLLGKAITASDINMIMFFEEELHFPEDLIEYLFEYCADKKKTNKRYIEATAIGWAKQGITSVNGAKLINAIYSENCYPVMKAFGLTGRNPADEERKFIDRWVLSYGFGLDIILEACNRTINTIHQPSFEYADSILKSWKSSGVTQISDIQKIDKEFAEKASSKRSGTSAKIKKTKASSSNPNAGLNNHAQRDFDYDELEAKLISK